MAGEFVRYFPAGYRDDNNFHLILVDESHDNGVILGSHIVPNRPRLGGAIRHVDDPHLTDHPHLRSQDGTWDFHPVHRLAFDFHYAKQHE